MFRIPNPVAQPCDQCGHPTVLAEFSTGLHRVHCGTYRYQCVVTGDGMPTPRLPARPLVTHAA